LDKDDFRKIKNNYKYAQRLQSDYNEFHYVGITTLMNNHTNLWKKLTDEDKELLKSDKRFSTRIKSEAYYTLPNYLRELKGIKPIVQGLIEDIKKEIRSLK
jgi:hypothetical protein